LGKEITSVSPATLKNICDYFWPGNIRALANVIERAVINTQGPVLRIVEHLGAVQPKELSISRKTLEVMERDYIIDILEDTGWRIEGPNGAARVLGLNPSTLRTRMAKLGVQRHQLNSV
jgi:chemotaxis protein methyltransferase CheR